MKLLNYTTPRLLIADEGKAIRNKNDVYVAEHMEDGVLIPEHQPRYSTVIFPAIQIQTLEDVEKLYVEEEMEG